MDNDPKTARSLVGIELDDKSHRRLDEQERDQFVDGVFAAASLPLVHVPVQSHYPTAKLHAFLRQKAGLTLPSPIPAPAEHTPVVAAANPGGCFSSTGSLNHSSTNAAATDQPFTVAMAWHFAMGTTNPNSSAYSSGETIRIMAAYKLILASLYSNSKLLLLTHANSISIKFPAVT